MNGNRESPGIRFGTRSLFVAIAALAVLFACYGWFHRRWAPLHYYGSVGTRIESLALHRPENMSRPQWESAVAWTINLHGNTLVLHTDGVAWREFDQRLAERLKREVTMETIHWIWDEYAQLSPSGAQYQKFRPVMIEEIDAGGGNWNIHVP